MKVDTGVARSPMTTAVPANDLQLLYQGRLLLGLGSQIRAHITRRFSMPWSQPAVRMREYILALRAIWDCWHNDASCRIAPGRQRSRCSAPRRCPCP